MIRFGNSGWELHPGPECEDCKPVRGLRDRFWARQFLQQFKSDTVAMVALRTLLAKDPCMRPLSTMTGDEVIDRFSALLSWGLWHVHGARLTRMGNDSSDRDTETSNRTRTADKSEMSLKPAPRDSSPSESPADSFTQVFIADFKTRLDDHAAPQAEAVHWVEIELLGDDGRPVPGESYEIRLPNGGFDRGELDENGCARVEDIPTSGPCRISFPRLDRDAWNWRSNNSETTAISDDAGEAYTAVQGDTLIRLGDVFGLAPESIWGHERNASLRGDRKDLNELLPGDRVFIPKIRKRIESGPTDRRHVFRRFGVPARCRIQVMYLEHAVPNAAYTFDVAGRATSGRTDANGLVDIVVPAQATRGMLVVQPDDDTPDLAIEVLFGYLDPLNSPSGVKKRLENLGFLRESDPPEKRLALALKRLQRAMNLEVTGVSNEASIAALEQLHDTPEILAHSFENARKG